jgi:hypothetical protein
MKRLLAAALVAVTATAAAPAWATGGLYCTSPADTSVEVSLTVGRVPGFAVVGARIAAGDTLWTMPGLGEGVEIVRSQASFADGHIVVDFTDPDVIQSLIELRLVAVLADETSVVAGSLWIHEVGHWPVICELE